MPHQNPPDEKIKVLLTDARTIAVVGASSNPEKSSNGVMKKLLAVGYHVIPINPRETKVLGQKAYPSLAAVAEKIDIVDVFRRPEETPPIADEAVAVGAKAIWLQSGIANEDTATRAHAGGLVVVMDACIAVAHARLGMSRSPPPPPPPPPR